MRRLILSTLTFILLTLWLQAGNAYAYTTSPHFPDASKHYSDATFITSTGQAVKRGTKAAIKKSAKAVGRLAKDQATKTGQKLQDALNPGIAKQPQPSHLKRGVIQETRSARRLQENLDRESPGDRTLTQRTLYHKEKDGKYLAAKDTRTGKGRRVDIVTVDKNGKVKNSYEVTSRSESNRPRKKQQIERESRIVEEQKTFIRDPDTGEYIEYDKVSKVVVYD